MPLNQLETGILFRNEKPHVKSVHAYFPSVAVLSDGTLVSTYMLGEAFEATNLQMHWSRSHDQGQTWDHQGQLNPPTTDRVTSTFGRVATTPDGELIANLIRYDRSEHPDEGLSNPQTLGLVPAELLLMRSRDQGTTWSKPETVMPPLVGPEFEMCSPITVLNDGRWLWPTSTWRDWDGNLPNGNRMVALVSNDQGTSWPEYLDIMHSVEKQLIFWESKVIELPNGRLLAVAWCYDEAAKIDRPNHYAFSDDGGASWSAPASTQLAGQTLTPYLMDDGSLLSVYRRLDQPGLWACHSQLNAQGEWSNLDQWPLWGHQSLDGTTKTGENMSANFAALKFGAPHITRLSDGSLFVTFWCYEQNVSLIRWFKFYVD
ncbi:sialidase family protein [Gimesia fumaroli]|uniref:BNR/Asp-box repeat protein n=1 Tax=Gimesia fumaroli TaxID=2527976 RepID=A0A518I9A5_9PLAN|nr:sialidase family protein [Gimesia fumaroli]QDV49693.1 BNR/Asp-box repeat protein [Gimesia fumaroli]